MWAKLVGASGLEARGGCQRFSGSCVQCVVVSESVFRGLGKGELGLCLCWGLLGAIRG